MEISSIGYYSNFTVSFILFLKSRSCEVIPPMWSMADKDEFDFYKLDPSLMPQLQSVINPKEIFARVRNGTQELCIDKLKKLTTKE